MKKLLLTLIPLFTGLVSYSQELYIKTFGNKTEKPILFLHGGPGGCAIDFELLTAPKLADKGFFVIIYDRRGEGRSDFDKPAYTFKETNEDINRIYESYNLKSATLLGHSFGGIVAIKFAESYPERVKSIVLAGAPVDLQMSFKTILRTVGDLAETAKDTVTLKQLDFVKKQDTSSVYYSSGSFMLAMQKGLYNTKTPDSLAVKQYAELMESPISKAYFAQMAKTNYKNMYSSSMGFLNNENYTSINVIPALKKLKGIPVYGLYGKEDGLFDEIQINLIKELTHDFKYLENCSHNAFMDRQQEFIKTLATWLK